MKLISIILLLTITLNAKENNTLTIDATNFKVFDKLDEMISSVENSTYRSDGDGDNPRDMGIQNAIKLIDHFADHFENKHSEIGSKTNSLIHAHRRSELLLLNVAQIKHDVIDADLAEVSMQYNQLLQNYQAMLATISKISKLSLVNYM